MEQHFSVDDFPTFPKKRTTSRGIPKFSRKFSFHSTLLPQFLKISVEWFAFRKFNSFRNFWKLFQEIYVPFAAVSKFSKVLVEWKAPQIKCWFQRREENRSTRRKTSRSRVDNQQTQPTYDAEPRNRTRATLVGGECSDTAPSLLPLFIVLFASFVIGQSNCFVFGLTTLK